MRRFFKQNFSMTRSFCIISLSFSFSNAKIIRDDRRSSAVEFQSADLTRFSKENVRSTGAVLYGIAKISAHNLKISGIASSKLYSLR